MMLRIYIHDEVPVTSIVVEGKLVGPWVNELEKCWETVVVAHPCKSMLVDLMHVTFIDSEGRALLTRMRRKGAKLLSSGRAQPPNRMAAITKHPGAIIFIGSLAPVL